MLKYAPSIVEGIVIVCCNWLGSMVLRLFVGLDVVIFMDV